MDFSKLALPGGSTGNTKKSRGMPTSLTNSAANTPAFQPLAAAKMRLRRGLTPKSRQDQKTNPKSVAAGKAALERARPVTITLRVSHRITSAPQCTMEMVNGRPVYTNVPNTGGSNVYGPGQVTVPRAVADVLLEMDRNAQGVEERATAPANESYIIRGGPGTPVQPVPIEMFDSYMGSDAMLSGRYR